MAPGKGREEAQPAAECHRVNQQPVLVDETQPHEAPGKPGASVRHDLLPGSCFSRAISPARSPLATLAAAQLGTPEQTKRFLDAFAAVIS